MRSTEASPHRQCLRFQHDYHDRDQSTAPKMPGRFWSPPSRCTRTWHGSSSGIRRFNMIDEPIDADGAVQPAELPGTGQTRRPVYGAGSRIPAHLPVRFFQENRAEAGRAEQRHEPFLYRQHTGSFKEAPEEAGLPAGSRCRTAGHPRHSGKTFRACRSGSPVNWRKRAARYWC